MKLIILEGPDGAGKSTLAEKFCSIGYSVTSFGVPPAKARLSEENMFRFFLIPILKGRLEPLVCDRLHLSDRIYAPLMRGGTPMTIRAEHIIERYIEAIDGQIVICLPPRRVAFDNWLARKGSEYVQDVKIFHKVYDEYAKLLFNQKRNRNFIWYDYTRHRAHRFVEALKQIEGTPLPDGMVGSQRPRFFVDVGPVDILTTKGEYSIMHDKLQKAGYQEHELAFSNLAMTAELEIMRPTLIEWHKKITIKKLADIRRNSP